MATILHRGGNFNEAKKHFEIAESLEKKRSSNLVKYLSSLWGFDYCLLLLDAINDNTILKTIITRSQYSINSHESSSLLTKSLDPLTLARVYVALNEFTKAENYFSQAIQNIQEAKKLHHTPPFYLYRAGFYLTQNQLDSAQADLNSAWEIIERCGMKLYWVDYLL